MRLKLSVLHDALTIPNAAVNHGPAQTYVYVVGPDSHVALRDIQVAMVEDAQAVITSGLVAGDEVVTDGQMALKPGALVSVRGPVIGAAAAPLAQDPPRGAPTHAGAPARASGPATPHAAKVEHSGAEGATSRVR